MGGFAYASQPTSFRPHGSNTSQKKTVTSGNQVFTLTQANTQYIRLSFSGSTSNVPCYVEIGPDSPVANATTSMRFNAGTTEYFKVSAGDKVAVIGTDGEIGLTEMSK